MIEIQYSHEQQSAMEDKRKNFLLKGREREPRAGEIDITRHHTSRAKINKGRLVELASDNDQWEEIVFTNTLDSDHLYP